MDTMELIRIPKVQNVRMLDKYSNNHSLGTLCPTTTHLLFKDPVAKKEIWVLYTHIASVEKQPLSTTGSPLQIKCKHFLTVTFVIPKERDCHDVYLTILKLSSPARIQELYCFTYRSTNDKLSRHTGWNFFDIQSEFQRLSVPNEEWSLSYLNTNYELCDTYPKYLYVPSTSTNHILHGSTKFRSKCRLPVLTYLHSNKAAICRCSQPLSGFNARCPEDEQMLYNILQTNPNSKYIYVVDTRPKINAMANRAAGKGYENENFYDNIKFHFFAIENIHVMRASLYKVLELQKVMTVSSFINVLENSGWLKHVRSVLEAAWFIARAVSNGITVVVHCSDGWDRTAQVCSLAALMLDPFYRTIQGFQALIEKDWLSFGHKFNDRCGHVLGDAKELSPIFTQFIDTTYQLLQQYPYAFQFNKYFLLTLHDHVHSCQYGTFIGNCEKDRQFLRLSERTYSLWGFIANNTNEYMNTFYCCNGYKEESKEVLCPKLTPQSIVFWSGLYCRFENGIHPRETSEDLLLTSYDHTSSLEDHVKLLIKRVNSLGKMLSASDSQRNHKAQLKQLNNEFVKSSFSNKIIQNATSVEEISKVKLSAAQVEDELKSVAIDWKSARNVEDCDCSTMFDTFNKKYHCWACGDIYCPRCMGKHGTLAGHLSQCAVPLCKSCSQNPSISSISISEYN